MICTLHTVTTTGILSKNKKFIHVKCLACLKTIPRKITEYQSSWFLGAICLKFRVSYGNYLFFVESSSYISNQSDKIKGFQLYFTTKLIFYHLST